MEVMRSMTIELREATEDDGRDVYEMLMEIGEGENGFSNSAYGVAYEEFPNYLKRQVDISRGIGLDISWQVPQTLYWLVIDGRPVGMGKLRDRLTEKLRLFGGHIGYCIRPSARGKGYGKVILAELLKRAYEKGVTEALLTVGEANMASRRVVESNSGKLERIQDGECYFSIKLGTNSGIAIADPDLSEPETH